MFNRTLLTGLCLALVAQSAPSFAQKKGTSMSISTGIVVQARQANLDSDAPKGAMIGGVR